MSPCKILSAAEKLTNERPRLGIKNSTDTAVVYSTAIISGALPPNKRFICGIVQQLCYFIGV